MNLTDLQKKPALIAAAAGFLGMALRFLLYRTGFDEKGILSASHPLHLMCLALTAGMLLYLALRTRKGPEIPEDHPQLRLALCLPAGFILLAQTIPMYRSLHGPLVLLCFLLSLAAGIAMVVCVFPVAKSRSTAALCHGLICAAFATDMLTRYRDWSGNPQLPDYVFHVLAGVALSLAAYQTLALHTGLGKAGLHRFFCLCALFLCTLCLAGPTSPGFYLSGALWAAACLLTVVPPEAVEEEDADVSA